MLGQYIAAFLILFILLVVHEYATSSQKEGGWARALVLALIWTGAAFIVEQVGVLAWIVVLPLLVMALKGVMGYSTIGSILFILFVSVIFQGILTIEAL